jgi:LPS O-antigen subunit length determinant protein (WzzB/FepE family)
MKKNNTYITDDEIDLGDLVRTLWREKILILSISVICGLFGYLFASFQPKEFKTVIQLKNPPSQLFEPYKDVFSDNINNNNNNNNNDNNNNNNNSVAGQYISDFKLNFLSLDNLQNFVEESREFDNFKGYLKSKNILVNRYFVNRITQVQEKDLIIPNKYFLVFQKELNGDIFLNNYVQFIKKKTVFEIKKKLKSSIENKIVIYDQALEKAKLINLENPILKSIESRQFQVVNEPTDLFYKGSKILSQELIYLKRLLIKLENDQFNYEILTDKPLSFPFKETLDLTYFAIGIMFGLFLSLGIIFFKGIIKNN